MYLVLSALTSSPISLVAATKASKVRGLPPEIRDTTEEVVIEWDNITELTEELFDVTGLYRLHTLVFDLTQIKNVGENHIN